MKNERTLAIRLLLKRGITPIDAAAEDDEIADSVIRRFTRGNVSMQQGNLLMEDDLERGRDAIRARLLKNQKA